MSVALLDLNDCNLQLWHGETHLESPGYTLFDGGDYVFGNAARAAARRRPRDINTRYWWQLGTEPLQPALGPARHTADLVHAHLGALHAAGSAPAEVVLSVPASMQREQLSLLLGIVQQCPFDAVGLVNRSVALASVFAGTGSVMHLELQLHQAVITELALRDGHVALTRSVPLPGCGLLQMQERLVEVIAGAFVRQARFDPRRRADSEQQLYDDLPATLRTLGDGGEANLEIGGYRARIAHADLATAGARLFDGLRHQLRGKPAATVLTESIAALLPGLREALPTLQVVASAELRAALAAHESRLIQRGEALHFTQELPLLGLREISSAAPAATSSVHPVATRQPTHLLRGAHARALRPAGTALLDGCEVFRADDGWQLRGADDDLAVNGTPYRPGQVLQLGDEIRIRGDRALLIEVEP